MSLVSQIEAAVEGLISLNSGIVRTHPDSASVVIALERIRAYRNVLATIERLKKDAPPASRVEMFIEQVNMACGRPVGDTVVRFVGIMCAKLKMNVHKGGWHDDTTESLVNRLEEEVIELKQEFSTSLLMKIDQVESHEDRKEFRLDRSRRIAREAADVANFAMFIADVEGGLVEGIDHLVAPK